MCSRSLQTEQVNDISLQLANTCLFPVLCKSLILAIFQSVGNSPSDNDIFNIMIKYLDIYSAYLSKTCLAIRLDHWASMGLDLKKVKNFLFIQMYIFKRWWVFKLGTRGYNSNITCKHGFKLQIKKISYFSAVYFKSILDSKSAGVCSGWLDVSPKTFQVTTP